MPILRPLATALISRRTARRLGRVIPNPILRYAVVTAATALVPLAVDRLVTLWQGRRGVRT